MVKQRTELGLGNAGDPLECTSLRAAVLSGWIIKLAIAPRTAHECVSLAK